MRSNRRSFIQWSATAAAGLLGTTRSAAASEVGPAPVLPLAEFPAPEKGPGAGWTVVMFPDTQNYAKYARNQPNFEVMTRWVAAHSKVWNIGLGLHPGDFVEQNDIAVGGGRGFGDQASDSQWASAKRAMAHLHGIVPVVPATGNHDYGARAAEDRRTRFNEYFRINDDPLLCDGKGGGILLESAPNAFGVRTLENAAYRVAPSAGPEWLVLSLEWGPRREVVAWARELLGRPEHAGRRCVLLTHSYLHDDNRREGDRKRPGNPHWYGTGKDGNTHDGEDLWRELIEPGGRIEWVVCGHVMGRHVGYRGDRNRAGRTVHQMLFNAQGLGGGSDEKGNGGDGWLRLMTLRPDGRTLDVRTFSPLLLAQGKDPWRRGTDHSFTMVFDA
jgi:Calcineurin-like phosphoesterase